MLTYEFRNTCNIKIRKVWRYQRGNEILIRRRTHNTMTKRTYIDLQNTTQKLKIEQHKSHRSLGVNSGAPEGLAVHDPPLTPAVILLNDTNIISDMESCWTPVCVLEYTDNIYEIFTPNKANRSKHRDTICR
jgi:hypothetical protein